MNDIATASDRGRRTIYTYFRTKNEIFEAVVGNEAQKILSDLENAIAAQTDATAQLRALIDFRINIARARASHYEVWYKSLFTPNVKHSLAVRQMVTGRLYCLLNEILGRGVASGEFNPVQAARTNSALTMLIRGTDWTMMCQAEQEKFDRWHRESIDFIIDGLRAGAANPSQATNSSTLNP